MWRRRLYLVLTVEAALLAVALFVLVIDPHYALSPGMRQVCAISTLVLAGGACYAAGRFLLEAVSNHPRLHHEPHHEPLLGTISHPDTVRTDENNVQKRPVFGVFSRSKFARSEDPLT
jgi:hypothetical protein